MMFEMTPCTEDEAKIIEEQAEKVFRAIAPPEPGAEEEEIHYKITDGEGNVIGGCTLETDEWETASLSRLWVDEPYRGKGIGSDLLRAFEQEAKKNGADRMMVEPFDWNVSFFRKNGYEKVTSVLEDFPKGHTMYCMEKPL